MSKLKVRDVMTTQVVSLKGDDTVKEATVRFAIDNVSGAPVVNAAGDLIGILSETDILELVMKHQVELQMTNPPLYLLAIPFDDTIDDPRVREACITISNTKVRDIMITAVLTTTPDAKITDVIERMIEKDINRVPVLEQGKLVGIVSRGDIIFSIYSKKKK